MLLILYYSAFFLHSINNFLYKKSYYYINKSIIYEKSPTIIIYLSLSFAYITAVYVNT